MKVKLWGIVMGVFLSVGVAYGQKHEVGLLLGGVRASDQGFRLPGTNTDAGKLITRAGLTFQANYAFRVAGGKLAALYGEVPIVATPSTDVEASGVGVQTVPRNYASLFVTPGLRIKILPDSTFSPYGAVGGGFARFEESETRINRLPNTGQRGTTTGAFDYGVGLDIKIVRHFAVRGELRDFVTGRPAFNVSLRGTRQHNLVTSGGIVVRF